MNKTVAKKRTAGKSPAKRVKGRKSPLPKPVVNPVVESLTLLLRAIPELFPRDRTAPGLVLAFLPNGHFYGSVVRYTGEPGLHAAKIVIGDAQADTLEQMIDDLQHVLVDRTENMQKLQRHVGTRNKVYRDAVASRIERRRQHNMSRKSVETWPDWLDQD